MQNSGHFMTLRLFFLILCASAAVSLEAYSQNGAPVWTNTFDGSSDDEAYSMALDKSGNVFVTGISTGTNRFFHTTTVAYANTGTALWTNNYFSATNGVAIAIAIAADSHGKVVLAGTTDDTNGASYLTVAYSAAGTPLWTNLYAPLVSSNAAVANALTMDSTGNVFVTGYGYSNATNRLESCFTLAYSPTGVPLWTNHYDGPAGGDSYAQAIVADKNGNVFVTGYSNDTNGGFEYATIAYSNAGLPLWTNQYSRMRHGIDEPKAIAVDGNGNVFVTGKSIGISGNSDYATFAYSSTGTPLWTNFYSSPFYGDSVGMALAVGANGNVFVTGNSAGLSGWDDYLTIAYSGAGVPLWTNRFDGGAYDDAISIALDNLGHVFVTGDSINYDFYDYVTIAYSPDGIPLLTNRFDGVMGRDDYPSSVGVDQNGNVFVTGFSTAPDPHNSSGSFDYATIKYASLIPQPEPLNFQVFGQQCVLTWTNSLFALECAPELGGTYTNVFGAVSPYTNSLSASQAFYRLTAK